MAVDDTSFYNIHRVEVTRSQQVQKMIDYYNELLELGDTHVTDFNEGSEIRNLLESFAVDLYGLLEEQNELSKIAFIETAEGEWLDKHGDMPQIKLPRDTGSVASGYAVFTVPSPLESEQVIPAETVLSCEDNGLDYMTEADTVMGVGETSATVYATCLTPGEDGNCPAGTLTEINDETINIPGLTVTNIDPFTGGTDYEEDDEYRARLLGFERKADFGSIPYYQNIGDTVNGVHDILLYANPNTSDLYTSTVIVNGLKKPLPDSVLIDVVEAFTLPDNIVIGHIFNVQAVEYKTLTFNVILTVKEEAIDETIIRSYLETLFNGGEADQGNSFEGLSIGESLTKTRLYETLYLLDGVENVYIEYNGAEYVDQTLTGADLIKVFRLDMDNLNITQNIT